MKRFELSGSGFPLPLFFARGRGTPPGKRAEDMEIHLFHLGEKKEKNVLQTLQIAFGALPLAFWGVN
ncbi:hypothetical protein [Beduinella massiliensis]|uniref:hypothetical protein n=1 Tax=Beduinella massiliensis TaxID=1852363 RepID=UPI0011AF480E